MIDIFHGNRQIGTQQLTLAADSAILWPGNPNRVEAAKELLLVHFKHVLGTYLYADVTPLAPGSVDLNAGTRVPSTALHVLHPLLRVHCTLATDVGKTNRRVAPKRAGARPKV